MEQLHAPDKRSAALSLGLVLLTAGALVAGTINVIDAHDFAEHYVSGTFLSKDIRIAGLPSVFVALICILSLVATGAAGFALMFPGWRVRGIGSGAVAALSAAGLWMDTHAVSSIKGIAEQVGTAFPWGEPQSEVNRAGWLFAGAVILSMILVRCIGRKTAPADEPCDGHTPPPRSVPTLRPSSTV